jgi:hypothetical protein
MASLSPPPVEFPSTTGKVGHRWSGTVIAAVIAVVAVVAAAVVAVIVFSGGPTSPPTPQMPDPLAHPSTAKAMAPAAVAAGTVTQALGLHSGARKTSIVLAASNAEPVMIGDGISITAAENWSVDRQGDHVVLLVNGDTSATLFVALDKVKSHDVVDALVNIVNRFNSADSPIRNVQMAGLTKDTLRSNNFQDVAAIAYTADVSTQQGTTPVYGVFLELLNTSTGESAFLDLSASSMDAGKAAAGDVDSMMSSML